RGGGHELPAHAQLPEKRPDELASVSEPLALHRQEERLPLAIGQLCELAPQRVAAPAPECGSERQSHRRRENEREAAPHHPLEDHTQERESFTEVVVALALTRIRRSGGERQHDQRDRRGGDHAACSREPERSRRLACPPDLLPEGG